MMQTDKDSDTQNGYNSEPTPPSQAAAAIAPLTAYLPTVDIASMSAAILDDLTALFLPNVQHAPLLPSDDSDDDNLHRQGFTLGDWHLMIRYQDASEISERCPIYPLPNAPAWFLGFANLHGLLVPVFDLKNYLDIGPTTGNTHNQHDRRKRPMLLVLQHHADSTGIMIDGLLEHLTFRPTDQITDALVPPSLAPSVMNRYLINEQLWLDIDVTTLLEQLETSLSA